MTAYTAETGIAYQINISHAATGRVDAGDMAIVRACVEEAGIALLDQVPRGDESPINRIYVDSAQIMDAVAVINSVGFTTDEDAD